MTIYLRQSTASQEVPLGYFLDDTDGKTSETALSIANTDIKLFKAGATTLANKNSGGATHISAGIYYTVLDATDTNTLGTLVIFVQVSGALPVKVECDVLPANVFDSRYGTDLLDVSVVQANGSAITQSGGRMEVNVSHFGGTAGTFASGRPEVNTTHAAGTAWGSGAITAASIASSAFTSAKFASGAFDAVWTVTTRLLTAGTNIVLAKGTGVTGFNDLDAAGVRSAVGLASANLDTQLSGLSTALVIRTNTAQAGASGTITLDASASATDNLYNTNLVYIGSGTGAGQTRTIQSYVGSTKVASIHPNWATNPDNTSVFTIIPNGSVNIMTWRGSTPNQLQSGRVDGYVGAMAADTLTASALATDAVTEIQSGLATSSALSTVAGYIDTEVAAIKAKTDNLPSDPADASDIASAFSTVNGTLATLGGYIDTEIGTIITNLATVDTVVDGIALKVADLWALDGLDSSNPMTVTPTSRTTGTIAQTLSGDGTTTTTVTRTA